MADVVEELALLNQQAAELLQKYDQAFTRLDEESQELTQQLINQVNDGLSQIQQKTQEGIEQIQSIVEQGGIDNVDKVDGFDASQSPQPNTIPVSDDEGFINAWIKQGEGSGLDADLLRGLPADFTASKAASGYQKLPSGLIIQWGRASVNGYGTCTFPIAFPNGCFVVVCVDTSYSCYNLGVRNITKNNFSVRATNNNNGNASSTFYFIAIGY